MTCKTRNTKILVSRTGILQLRVTTQGPSDRSRNLTLSKQSSSTYVRTYVRTYMTSYK